MSGKNRSRFISAYPNGQTSLDQFDKVYVCPWCGRVYTNPSSLSLHKRKCDRVPDYIREQWRIEAMRTRLKEIVKLTKDMRNIEEELKIMNENELRRVLERNPYIT